MNNNGLQATTMHGFSVVAFVAFLTLSTAASAETMRDEIEAACRAQRFLSPTGCACLAARAMVDLDTIQRDWLLATLRREPGTANRIETRMPPHQRNRLATFMTTVPAGCRP